MLRALQTTFVFLTLLVSVESYGYTPAVRKTVAEFLAMSENDSTFCELKGVVSRVRNYEKGRLFIDDGTGNVLIYNIFDYRKHKSFPALDVRMGDTLTVRGRRFVYDGRVIEMKNALYESHTEGPDHANIEKRDSLDKNPTFRGKGKNEFSKWVSRHLRYPESAGKAYSDGEVVCRFIVGRDGSVLYPEIIKGVHPALDEEVIRVMKKAPKWKPGIVDGHPVRVEMKFRAVFISDK